ncbi:hypothetical protein C1645_825077 [Glomus cerebriforme]|uniref:Uncharacterized protein n=1 Tax=Glomus cerebriforme TaxID=658196 RepID=A0A397SUB5_9GLOM|nr:hypothetical protein C1645_825077 [Glomus cerebriforme]
MNQNILNSSDNGPNIAGFFYNELDNNYSNGLQQLTEVIQTGNQVYDNNLDTSYTYTVPSSVINNGIFPAPLNTFTSSDPSFNTASSTLQYCAPQYINSDTNGQVSNHSHSDNSRNKLHSSQPQINQCGVYKFEIPGFEIIVRPKSNPMINLNNLGAQSHSSTNSYYSPTTVMSSQLNQNQNYIPSVENSANESYANSVNSMNIMNMQNIYNDQPFFTDNSQSQFQQQN